MSDQHAPSWIPSSEAVGESLHAEVVEQVMRIVDDEILVLPFLVVRAGTPDAERSVGRLATATSVRLHGGSPLVALIRGTKVDPRWRADYPAGGGCLWATLTFLSSLYGPQEADDPYSALEQLRTFEAFDLGLTGSGL